jgi:N-acetyl sugar amidotransferase
MAREYQICSRCIMDTTDPDIQFDGDGVCNHCRNYEIIASRNLDYSEVSNQKFERLVNKIKKDGEGRKYDCLIGLSGGVDSTYVAYLTKKLRLRPLAVHLDNGWDSELAVKNVENILRKLDIDLFTYVLDWEEFKDLQVAYFKASVIDIEALTDHAIMAALYNIANERGIKYILTGSNTVTEAIMPKSWSYHKNDLVNLKAIHKQFGTVRLKRFPVLGILRKMYFHLIKGIKSIPILDYVHYVKKDAKQLLTQQLEWRDYGGKHYESVFTRFYQAYILPRKFNVDKRKAHLSTLICSGQMTREETLKEMQEELYPAELLRQDKEYVLKKLRFTEEDFERIMNLPVKNHCDYKSSLKLLSFVRAVRSFLERKKGL